jgi:DNA invertase Pin-like site-specific DNA recombinase
MTAGQEILSMPARAYSLIRFSTPDQRKGDSKRRQCDFAAAWCAEHDAVLDDSLELVAEGQSAFRGHHRTKSARIRRPLAEFLEHVKTGRVCKGSILIVENIDRLSREEIDEAYEVLRQILKAGVDVVTQSPERRYTKKSLNDMLSILELKFCMYRAHDESKQKSRRCRAAWEQKKQRAIKAGKPLTHSCPAWIELTGDGAGEKYSGDGYRLIPERAEVVRRLYAMVQDGLGISRIQKQLHEDGTPSFGYTGRWTPAYIRSILRNPAAYGTYQVGRLDPETGRPTLTGEEVPNYYPAAVPESEWRKVQAIMTGRKRRTGRPGTNEANLFTGLLWEARSRDRLHCKPKRNAQGRRYEYLMTYDLHLTCGIASYQPVEDFLVACLEELTHDDVLPPGRKADEREKRIGELTEKLMNLGLRREALEAQAEDPAVDPDLLPSLLKMIPQVVREEKATAKELRFLKEQATTGMTEALGDCQNALKAITSPEERRRAKARIQQVVEAIWLLVQPVSSSSRPPKIVHAQIYLRGGRRIYRQLPPKKMPPGVRPWDLSKADFRAGDIGHVARHAEALPQLVG